MSLYDDPYAHYYPLRHYTDERRRGLTNLLFARWKSTHFDGIKEKWLQFIHDTYVDINDKIDGRLGLSLWDCYIVGSILAKSHRCLQNRPDHGYIETGTCHGGSAIFAAKVLEKCKKPKQTIITMDLMDGVVDPGTDVAVTEETFWSNVDACQVDPSRIKLVIGNSYGQESREQVKDYKFHMLFIDGDHRYEGAKGDWDSYSRQVVQDGYAIFHDYRMAPVPKDHEYYDQLVSSWKDYGIKKFVDQNVVSLTQWHSYGEPAPANMYVLWRL